MTYRIVRVLSWMFLRVFAVLLTPSFFLLWIILTAFAVRDGEDAMWMEWKSYWGFVKFMYTGIE